MLALSVTLLGIALAYEAGNIGIGLLAMGVISFGIMYTPWYSTPDHDRPTPGLLSFAFIVWLFVAFGALYSVLISYDVFALLGFAVLVLPAYRTLRSAVGAPAVLRSV